MEIKPINQRKSPNYPILEYYIENPEIFSQHIPHRWIKNQYVATSLSVFVLCGNMPCTAKPNSKNIEVVTTVKGNETLSFFMTRLEILILENMTIGKRAKKRQKKKQQNFC